MSAVEALAQERRRILLTFTLSYAVWCGAFVLGQSGWLPGGPHRVLGVVSALFSLVWIASFVWLWSWGLRVRRQPQVIAALNDEVTVRNRWRAQRASAFVLLVCLMGGVAVTSFVDISGRLAMLMLIWVLVVSQLGFYLFFDGQD
jgi:hypothetical protein